MVLEHLLRPAALLALLGLSAVTSLDPAAAECTAMAKSACLQSTSAEAVSQDSCHAAAAASASSAAAVLCEQQGQNAEALPLAPSGKEFWTGPQPVLPGPSLLAMLGLGAGPGGSPGGTAGVTCPHDGKEENAGQRLVRLAGIARALVEVLLECLVTQPEVSCCTKPTLMC